MFILNQNAMLPFCLNLMSVCKIQTNFLTLAFDYARMPLFCDYMLAFLLFKISHWLLN